MKNILFHLLTNYFEDEHNVEVIGALECGTTEVSLCNKMFDLTPGTQNILPKECLNITLCVHPLPNTTFHAEAICLVEGGEPKMLAIEGSSSEIGYAVSSKTVEFGTQV